MNESARISEVINNIDPDKSISKIEKISSGFTNQSYLVELDDSSDAYIVKFYSGDAVQRSTKEHELLKFLQTTAIPCPAVVYYDTSDAPVMVTKRIDGQPIMGHPPTTLWESKAERMGELIARIHQLSCSDKLISQLPDATIHHTKFLAGTIPDYMRAYTDGEMIWNTVHEHIEHIQWSHAVLLHGDYWSGNLLWDAKGDAVGVMDWELSCYGEAAYDVAYCRMEYLIDGMNDAAERFLKSYENRMGKPVANLPFCELAIATIPMAQRAPYLHDPTILANYKRFVQNALVQL